MTRRAWGQLVPAVILAIGVAGVTHVRAQRAIALRAPLAALPRVFDEHVGSDASLASADVGRLGVSQYLLRQYRRDTLQTFSLYVGYYASQARGRTIHSPRNCLPGAGWNPLESGRRMIATSDGQVRQVNRFLVGNGGNLAVVYYWYQGRGRVVANEYEVKWRLLIDAVRWRRSDEALVRIVVPVAAGTPEQMKAADALASRVSGSLIPRVALLLPPVDAPHAVVALID